MLFKVNNTFLRKGWLSLFALGKVWFTGKWLQPFFFRPQNIYHILFTHSVQIYAQSWYLYKVRFCPFLLKKAYHKTSVWEYGCQRWNLETAMFCFFKEKYFLTLLVVTHNLQYVTVLFWVTYAAAKNGFSWDTDGQIIFQELQSGGECPTSSLDYGRLAL